MDQTSRLLACHPSIQCYSGTGTALHPRHGFSTGDSTHHTPPPHPKNRYPKEGALVPVLSTLGCCPANAGGVLGGERSFLWLPLLPVALTERVITKSGFTSAPGLVLPCLTHSARVCSPFQTRSTSPVPRERSSGPSPQPKCPTFPFRTPPPRLLRPIRPGGNIRPRPEQLPLQDLVSGGLPFPVFALLPFWLQDYFKVNERS